MVTGGSKIGGKSVELLSINGTRMCSLPDLPEERWQHSQNGLLSCGGSDTPSVRRLCVTFAAGNWKKTHILGTPRYAHTGWASPRGVLLIGGYYIYGRNSLTATELLKDNGETTPSVSSSPSLRREDIAT